MISALLLCASLFGAPSPSHAYVAQVDAHLKAAFARAPTVAAAAPRPSVARQGRAPRPLPR